MARFCGNCGGEVKMEDTYCMHCGKLLDKEPAQEKKWKEYDWDKEEWKESDKEPAEKTGETAKVVSMKEYLLLGILLAIPFLNLGVCVALILNKKIDPNRRNLAKAWLVLNIIGLILGGLLAFGLVQFFVFDHPVDINHHIEYSIPEQQLLDEILTEL